MTCGRWRRTADGFIDIANFLDKQVLIEGLAQFRPSGALLRIDTDAIREAGPKDDSFSVIPVPELRRNYQPEAVSARPGQQPFTSIFGMIPGDETDEEYTAAVNALS